MITEQKWIEHLEACFNRAEKLESKLTQEIHDIPGMTGAMTRHFYNNLLSIHGIKYLEIGCWQGSSTCSAMFGNAALVCAIDDFSSFGSPEKEFFNNFCNYRGDNEAYFIKGDCFKVPADKFESKFNIYLFDGDHSEASQFKALDYYLPAMEDVFVFIADDANWKSVRDGTNLAIANNGLKILWKKEILLDYTNEFTQNQELAKNTWWNGIIVYLLKK